MKRLVFLFIIFFSILFLGIHSVHAESIQSFETVITVASDSSMYVEEKIQYDFGFADRHGIYRTIPYTKTNTDNDVYTMTIDDITVRDERGVSYTTKQEKTNTDIQLRVGDANKTITGTHLYHIGYRVQGAFVPFSDHDELYWNITGNGWEVPIEQVNVAVTMPFITTKENMQLACFTGVAKSTTRDCSIAYENGVIVARTTTTLSAEEGVTIVIGFPKGLMTIEEAKKVNTWFADLVAKIVAFLLVVLAVLWYIGLPIWIIIRWFRTGRDPKGTIGKAHVWFDVPKTKTGRGLTPAEAGVLVDETADLKDIIATLVDLARRGYIKIIEKKKNDFYLEQIRQSVRGDTLEEFEQTLLTKIFPGAKTAIRVKDEDLSGAIDKVKEQLYDAVVQEGFFPKNPQKTRTIYTVLAGVALFTGNIGLAIIAFLFGRHMPKKTIEGVNAANVTNALKGFIVSQDRQYAFQAKKQLFFEKFLPYAIVFGVEKIWAERFKNLNIIRPDWYETYDNRAFNAVLFMNHFGRGFSSTVGTSATPTRSSSGFSSGFSSGGGFSGGGGGGGGGGSW